MSSSTISSSYIPDDIYRSHAEAVLKELADNTSDIRVIAQSTLIERLKTYANNNNTYPPLLTKVRKEVAWIRQQRLPPMPITYIQEFLSEIVAVAQQVFHPKANDIETAIQTVLDNHPSENYNLPTKQTIETIIKQVSEMLPNEILEGTYQTLAEEITNTRGLQTENIRELVKEGLIWRNKNDERIRTDEPTIERLVSWIMRNRPAQDPSSQIIATSQRSDLVEASSNASQIKKSSSSTTFESSLTRSQMAFLGFAIAILALGITFGFFSVAGLPSLVSILVHHAGLSVAEAHALIAIVAALPTAGFTTWKIGKYVKEKCFL